MIFHPYLLSFLLAASAVIARPYTRGNVHKNSNHWAGVLALGNSRDTFTDVRTTFHTPSIKGPFTGNSAFAILVGLDDESCPNGYARAGIDVLPDHTGKPYYKAWSMWHPWGQKEIFDMSVSEGDEIEIYLTAWAFEAIIVIVENHTTKQTEFRRMASTGHPICAQDAVVVLEPYHPKVAIANFGEVVFTNGTAYKNDGSQTGWKRILLNLVQHNKVTARALDGSLRIEYVG